MTTPIDPDGRTRKVFILCFDGTGNKFNGTEADSNILKLYRMLDRSDATTFTFYQPGIGTYTSSTSFHTKSAYGRLKSWYMKAKDSAIGTSFADHVMGGYKFLMRYYSCEDDLYFFGFSRGAYTARFLAEMLDHIGLLSAGNEELISFAWKTYAKWQSRTNDGSEAAKKKEAEIYRFTQGFRETFSRPVRRIRFLGLFDTVNSVPRFESAFLQRSKFPYTAKSSAKVIRHAVSIDERRAKFRQDLIGVRRKKKEDNNPNIHRFNSDFARTGRKADETPRTPDNRGSSIQPAMTNVPVIEVFSPEGNEDDDPRPKEEFHDAPTGLIPIQGGQVRSGSTARPILTPSTEDLRSITSSNKIPRRMRRKYSDATKDQDILEVWFPGGHGDIGGGWTSSHGEEWMLSHVPLVWMVQEAEKAGLQFDPFKMAKFMCIPDVVDEYGDRIPDELRQKEFLEAYEFGGGQSLIHDCLEIGGGLPKMSVLSWKLMEYLPFRRMDLRPDGSWKAIRWPLPAGETRDIPNDAIIHGSAIRRMQYCEDYRPGNLIVGGGGRGVKKAPKEYGIGAWEVCHSPGDVVKETYVRKNKPGEIPGEKAS